MRSGENTISRMHDPESYDEAALIKACQAGDSKAFKVLYSQYVSRVYAQCLRLSGENDEAADIAQEVFIQVWEKIRSFKGESAFSTWLHRVTSNIAISYVRKRKHWWQKLSFSSEEDYIAEPVAPVDSSNEGLERAILQLPEQARLVFVLFAIEGYRHEEVGKLLGIAVGSSKAQYFRARALLKEYLENEE